jgi:hypothetical protein
LLACFGGLAWLASRAPTVDAAGNPLYLHGSGTAPGCVATTLDQAIGAQPTVPSSCAIQSSSGGVTTTWGFTNLPAQTVTAGVWTFTMYWTGGSGATNDTVTITAGVSATASCVGFVATIPNPTTSWSTTYGSSGVVNTTSPFTVSTSPIAPAVSGSQLPLVIAQGGSLCLSVTLAHNTGGRPSMVYDGIANVADTRVVPPSIIVPESLLGLIGLAAFIPIVAARKRLFVRMRK